MELNLGNCCICEKGAPEVKVCNIVMLDLRVPLQHRGRGWGCVQCGLAMEGAVAVLCDPCLDKHVAGAAIKLACLGSPADNVRIPIGELKEKFEHDMAKHPEENYGYRSASVH